MLFDRYEIHIQASLYFINRKLIHFQSSSPQIMKRIPRSLCVDAHVRVRLWMTRNNSEVTNVNVTKFVLLELFLNHGTIRAMMWVA